MTPVDALRALAETVVRVQRQPDPAAAAQDVLQLAVRVSHAREGFLARVEGTELLWTQGFSDSGAEAAEVPAKTLARVGRGVRESLQGVADAPPHMTGGAAPAGAVAVKAEAGQPPVHAFPLLDPLRGTLEGVLGLIPDPTAPEELGEAGEAVLTVLKSFLDPGRLQPQAPAPSAPVPRPGGGPSFVNDYSEIVSRSEKVYAVFSKLDRIVAAKVPVLICGETGTGKELIARAIHRNDPQRRDKRFYTQNCGAIPGNLLESELFGHLAGSFTGADRDKQGLFQIASGSTLFLDEIGEMSLDMQTRLLRVLQEGEIVPIGSTDPLKVDVRIVAATLRDLEGAISEGTFRQDLYFRLKVVRLNLPPLRERPEDVPFLADHFLRKAAREIGKRPKVLDRRDPRLIQALCDYSWPGNVRELENLVRRLALLLPEEVITYEALAEVADAQLTGRGQEPETQPVRNLEELLDDIEKREIDNALRVTDNNRTKAAQLLGLNRRSLFRRMQKYGYAPE